MESCLSRGCACPGTRRHQTGRERKEPVERQRRRRKDEDEKEKKEVRKKREGEKREAKRFRGGD